MPTRVADLSRLPRTFIGVGSIDLFAEEDIDFARRLVAAQVPTELLVVPGAFHGFQMIVPKSSVSQRFNAALEAALGPALTPEKMPRACASRSHHAPQELVHHRQPASVSLSSSGMPAAASIA